MKKQRTQEAETAKDILQQISELDTVINSATSAMAMLESEKAKMLADMCVENNGDTPRRNITLGEILNDAQFEAVIGILNKNVDSITTAKMLKQYLGQFSKQLAAVGVLPDYLAYVLLANKEKLCAAQKQSKDPEDPFKPDYMSRN